jgi:glutamyl-tRNA reductase
MSIELTASASATASATANSGATARAALASPATSGPTVVAVILHARTVPSLVREAFAAALAALPFDERAIVIHTCHRVEVYVAPGTAGMPSLPPLPAGAVQLADVEAVRHLIAVACGLDSVVFGEDQILHQVRTCLAERHADAPLEPVLDRLFQSALRAGRRARTWFDGSPRSLADVALDRIARTAGSLTGLPVLVAGAGRMGRLVAFAAHRRGARVVVTNRTGERAKTLAAEVGGHALPFAVDGVLPPLAGAIVALAGPWQPGPVDAAALAASSAEVVDISSPPSVPQDLQAALGPRFTSVDDLTVGTEFEPQDRLRRRIEKLVSETGREYCGWLRARDAVPVIKAVAEGAETLRRSEVEWLLHRLPELADDERAVVEQMSHRLVAALLHAPLAALHDDDAGSLERAARDLFGV